MNRREFIAATAAPLLFAKDSVDSSLVMITAHDGKNMRDVAVRARGSVLEALVDKALHAGPWSVTFHRPSGADTKAGPNDYFSEGPYWWPDPNNPNGPYIRRDGKRNPDRFISNHNDLGSMCEAVLALGMGAYLLDKRRCAQRAAEVLSVWLVDPKTRMNPNLEFGQAIRGVSNGRGTGLIDVNSFIYAVQGIALLEAAHGLDLDLIRSLRHWFAEFLNWMTTSAKGLDEKNSGNNHATWWAAKAAAFALFIGNAAAQRMAWDDYRHYLVPSEIRPDGSCPREEARTNSLGYSAFNLDAFATICRLAQIAGMHLADMDLPGMDLWHFKTAQDTGVEKAFDYLVPYVLHPDTWRKQQIGPFSSSSIIFPGLAALGLPSQALLSAYDRLPRAKSAWVQFIDLLLTGSRSTPGILRR